ncbi:MAG: MotA/TolQ/ExbB proton channel family protein, partial [Photobacterium halotolerans]
MDLTLFSSEFAETWWISLQQFMQQGGQILWWLAVVVLFSWLLVAERLLYLAFTYPKQKQQW